MSRNLAKAFRDLVPAAPLQIGTVTAAGTGVAVVELLGGGRVNARGHAQVGDRVFVRDGLIEGVAPNLPVVMIEV